MNKHTDYQETLILDTTVIPLHIQHKRKLHLSFRFIDGTLFVSAPLNASVSDIKTALKKKESWILKHYALSQRRLLGDHEIRLHDSRLRVVDQIGKTFAYAITADQLIITHPSRMKAENALKRFKKEYSEIVLTELFNQAIQETGLKPSSMTIRDTTSSHGRCNSKKQITLSSSLIAYSYPYIRYVCIHELVHLRHMNHSKAFYALVSVYCPDYKKLVAQVRSAVL
jgi:predicted metal-dependent hydrolase